MQEETLYHDQNSWLMRQQSSGSNRYNMSRLRRDVLKDIQDKLDAGETVHAKIIGGNRKGTIGIIKKIDEVNDGYYIRKKLILRFTGENKKRSMSFVLEETYGYTDINILFDYDGEEAFCKYDVNAANKRAEASVVDAMGNPIEEGMFVAFFDHKHKLLRFGNVTRFKAETKYQQVQVRVFIMPININPEKHNQYGMQETNIKDADRMLAIRKDTREQLALLKLSSDQG